ncbi:unnamed protein product [Choristocarpus tenellus]
MLLAEEFYDRKGELCWKQVVSHLKLHPPPEELQARKEILVLGREAVAVGDVKIVVHGYRQCVLFWLAACRLARRGYAFSTVVHQTKALFKALLADVREEVGMSMSHITSPLMFVTNLDNNTRYYIGGYGEVCHIF